MYDFILNFKIKQNGLSPKGIFQTPSPLRGTPSINRGRADYQAASPLCKGELVGVVI